MRSTFKEIQFLNIPNTTKTSEEWQEEATNLQIKIAKIKIMLIDKWFKNKEDRLLFNEILKDIDNIIK